MKDNYKKLGDVAEFINGVAFKPQDWGEDGQRIIRIQNLTDSSKPYNRTRRPVDEKYHVAPGDILVSWSATLGVFIWNESDTGILNQHIFRVVPYNGSVDRRYLRYALDASLADMERHLHGATMKHVNRGEFLATKIYTPPLPEQQRIAAILDAADALREKRRQAIAKLDGLVQAVFVEMFGDPSARNQRWPIATIADVCKSRLGKMLDEKQQSGQHARMYLRNANVQWHRFNLTDVNEMDFDERDREKFRLVPGDLLVCEGGEPGRCAIWNGEIEECYYQKALHRIRPDRSRLDVQYIAHLFWHLARRGGFSDHITSATIAHLTGEKLKAMKIPVPPLEIQEQFANTVSTINRVKTTQQASLAHLDTLFLSLQQRAFRGEL